MRASSAPATQAGRSVRSPNPVTRADGKDSLAGGDGNGRPSSTGHHSVLGVKPSTAAGNFEPEPDRSTFAGGSKDWCSSMSTTLPGSALPRRLLPLLMAALFGLTLILNPMSTQNADAATSAAVGAHALYLARREVGARYRFGGASPATGFDCSGLTQWVYYRAGKRLPRTAQQQYNATIRVSRRAARKGDLVFFYSGRSIYHVGIYAGNGNMYAAPHTGARVMKEWIWTTHVLFGRVR